MKLLNLGCGQRFHKDWVNVDFTKTGEGVVAHDLSQGIPFPDKTFDVVYHSHVLEHIPRDAADFFVQECYRVLNPEGVIRVVVPDLEQITRFYLKCLDKIKLGEQSWVNKYDWALLELYDQSVRETTGGRMAQYLANSKLMEEHFLVERIGEEAKTWFEKKSEQVSQKGEDSPVTQNSFLKLCYRFVRYSHYRQEAFFKILLGKHYSALQLGRFRRSGEIHQWMYDSYSLRRLLEEHHFVELQDFTPQTSYVSNWEQWNLDVDLEGSIYRPNSLFIEGKKLLN